MSLRLEIPPWAWVAVVLLMVLGSGAAQLHGLRQQSADARMLSLQLAAIRQDTASMMTSYEKVSATLLDLAVDHERRLHALEILNDEVMGPEP